MHLIIPKKLEFFWGGFPEQHSKENSFDDRLVVAFLMQLQPKKPSSLNLGKAQQKDLADKKKFFLGDFYQTWVGGGTVSQI